MMALWHIIARPAYAIWYYGWQVASWQHDQKTNSLFEFNIEICGLIAVVAQTHSLHPGMLHPVHSFSLPTVLNKKIISLQPSC